MEEGSAEGVDEQDLLSISEIITSLFFNPVNIALLCVILCLIYQLFLSRKRKATPPPSAQAQLIPMKKQDMTSQQLRQYDGTNEDERVCIAVNGKIFDVTKGKRYYGPGGPYAAFAGRDATRGFATFSVEVSDKEYDDLSDLNTMQMESVKEWEMQFQEKYEYVGRLLKPGELPTDYSDEEEHTPTPEPSQAEKSKGNPANEEQAEDNETGESKSAEEIHGKATSEQVFQDSVQKVPKKSDPFGDHLGPIPETSDKEEKSESSKTEVVPEELAKKLVEEEVPKKLVEEEVD